MKIQIRHIALIFALLLLGGVANEAWADVTYHILTRPFTTYKSNGVDVQVNNGVTCSNIRVEALRFTSSESTVGMLAAYKSPLLKDAAYSYYKTVTTTANVQIYASNGNVKYTVYNTPTDPITPGSNLSDNGNPTDIYVTYDYDPKSSTICTELGQSLKLDGTSVYNIEIGNNAFFAYNQVRGNRPGVIPKSDLYSIDHIASDEMVEVIKGLLNTYDNVTGKIFYFKWKFLGEDPYNIHVVLAYDGNGTYVESNERAIKGPGTNTSNMVFAQVGANMWVSNESHYEWKNGAWSSKYGWYRGMKPPFDSFVLLNHTTANYTLVGSKINDQPKNGQYMHLINSTNLNPRIEFKSANNAAQIKFYKVKEYIFKVKTPLSNTVLSVPAKVSEYYLNDNVKDHIPIALKRKYVNFIGSYREDTFENANNTFKNVDDDVSATEEDGKKVIWLKYESTLPFTSAAAGSTYDNLTWYNFYTNKDNQYIVRYNSTEAAFNTTGTDGSRYARTSHFAFVGDPFEMKIVSRQLSDVNSGTLRYLKLNSPISGNITEDATGTAWDILYDDNSDDYAGCFRLREFTSTNNSVNHLAWNYGSSNYPLIGTDTQGDAARLTVVAVPQKNYVYHIMRSDHSIAVKATKSQEASTKLDYAHIPDTIRSPFLALTGVTLSFYASSADAIASTNAITHAPDNATDATQDIWVRYDMGTALSTIPGSYITGSTSFNVRLNRQYIYYDSSSGTIKSSAAVVDSNNNGNTDDETNYLWTLGGSDPYAMTIVNSANNKFVTIADGEDEGDEPYWADGTISWSDTAPASKFIIKGTENTGVWEMMAATGDDIDAATTYYNIGRDANTDVTKLYGNATYQHNYNQLSFQLTPTGAKVVTYHLIDKARTDLLQVTARHLPADVPLFPDDYRSPLVTTYHYWSDAGCSTPLATIGEATAVYVTYDTSTSVDLLNKKTMYLLKFAQGTPFKAEDGSDGLEENPVTPVYPYCNGDCNFFVYGQAQFDLQQQGAASTRTRWAWFLESANNDPYHVKICSRQTETYNEDDVRAYFATYQPDDYDKIITGLVWPNISGIQGTEYMILGSSSLYRLETTNPIALDANHDGTPESTQRYTVKSFEQYWKTYDTLRRKVLKQNAENYPANYNDPSTVPATPYVVGDENYTSNRTYLTDEMNFHHYNKWAYAKRWNGYNNVGKTSKGWEEIEHWFQTVEMGEGYFTLVPIDINPVLILLDQHGWEIMRKPLPTSPDDDTKYAKYDEIRPYDSPMVKEYYFWTKASKRSGFHQYYNLSQQVYNDGKPYTSTSLTDLPPYYTATNLKDAKGNHLDEYVTYTVKDEYIQTYNSTTKAGQPFLIQQGDNYASYNGSTLTTTAVSSPGGMSKHIVDAITANNLSNDELWYVKPNARIDYEMGYVDEDKNNNIPANHDWDTAYSGNFSNGFDPYNIQISSVRDNSKYFVTNATGATLEEGAGSLIGSYDSAPTVTLGTPKTNIPCSWYDSRALAITNATFMAVQDDEGNMQLMPRFDQTQRMKDFITLTSPTDPAIAHTYTLLFRPLVYNYHIIDNEGRESLRYRSGGDLDPQMPDHFKSPLAKDFKYYSDKMAYNIYTSDVDEWKASGEGITATSDANMISQVEALTSTGTYFFKIEYYKKVQVTTANDGEKDAVYEVTDANSSNWGSADGNHQKTVESEADMTTQAKALTDTGDYYFKIVYYKRVTFNPANGIGSDVASHADISNREITSSFASAGLTAAGSAGNNVYVRYSYDKEADALGVLEGKWFTMQLNGKDAILNSGIKQGTSKPESVGYDEVVGDNDDEEKIWQWKFLDNPLSNPDPYAVQLFNRNNPGANNELLSVGTRFAVLSHSSGGYALAEAGTTNTNYDTYNFLNGNGAMNTSTPATIEREANFLSTSCSFNGTNSQVLLVDDVTHEFTYKIYTNGGVFAISATQDNETLTDNKYVPILPERIKSPLLNMDQFIYYEQNLGTIAEESDTLGKSLNNLYGLYDDYVYVRYDTYNPLVTDYKVPNERNAIDAGQVARANTSNDASIGIGNDLLYNIIWHSDNMMTGDIGNTITDGGNRELGGSPSGQVWYFAGNDPYAIKLRTSISDVDRYVHKVVDAATCNLTATEGEATTFMLLPREDNYEYGMLQVTGDTGKMTGFGNTLTTDDEVPNKFIIFALSTHKVTYHLVIANIGSAGATIPYFENGSLTNKTFEGTTQRNLTNNPIADHEVGHISLGDPLKVPTEMIRPNVDYFFYVDDIYDVKADGTDDNINETLTGLYKGHNVTAMAADSRLVGKHVKINIVYTFQGGLATNAGEGFVLGVAENKWYTFEAKKSDGTPLLSQFTNAWGMEVKEGRGTHYTNDYLWTPIGDPYGYVMYHRYTCVNSGGDNKGEPKRIMTTTAFSDGQAVTMGVNKGPGDEGYVYDPNSVYELLADENTTPGYFKIHPVANSAGTQYYFKIIHDYEDPADLSTPEHDYVRLSSSSDYTEFTFGLSEELVKPYYDRAGYVGGLTTTPKAGQAKSGKKLYEEATNLMEKQAVVYNPVNIVDYAPGYYRLHSPEDIEGVTVRYASGYTHKLELTGDLTDGSAIPMHFYERKGVNTTFEILANGYTRSAATRGAIPINPPEYDPASIFYFYEGSAANPYSRVQTQGLYVKGAKGPGLDGSNHEISENVEATNERAAAIMTETEGEATPLYVMDIGGAILLIHDNVTGERRGYLKYLSYHQNDGANIYDLKLTHNTHTDHAKWLMQPANHLGLQIATHNGGDADTYGGTTYNYTTFYAPFDVLLPDTVMTGGKIETIYHATILESANSPWDPEHDDLHPKSIGRYNTADNGCPAVYVTDEKGVAHALIGNDRFIPAGTPVLIGMHDLTGYVKVTLPNLSPHPMRSPFTSSRDETNAMGVTIAKDVTRYNILTGQYLEQLLPYAVAPGSTSPHRIYSFGLPFNDESVMTFNKATGEIGAVQPRQEHTGMGFYLNANPNKELGLSKAEWIRNNWYVYANKAYYHANDVSSAPGMSAGVEFVPVIFDFDNKEEGEQQGDENRRQIVGDNCIYDLQGRKMATEQQVKDGTWRQLLKPGVYIINGKKIAVSAH